MQKTEIVYLPVPAHVADMLLAAMNPAHGDMVLLGFAAKGYAELPHDEVEAKLDKHLAGLRRDMLHNVYVTKKFNGETIPQHWEVEFGAAEQPIESDSYPGEAGNGAEGDPPTE